MKRIACLGSLILFAISPAAAETVNDLLGESPVRSILERAFGHQYHSFQRAMIDPRLLAKQRREDCVVRPQDEYRIAVCGKYDDPYGTGYIVLNRDASQFIAGFAHEGSYVVRASEDWARAQPGFVLEVMKNFSGTLPAGIIGRING